LDSPVFARLQPIATEFGWPADWRLPRTMPTDIGDRPNLDSLGPLCWSPSPAPEWTLSTATAETESFKQRLGKPMIVIFYLGHGCLHCVEQIQAFVPKADAFSQQGIDLIAISSDAPDKLRLALENDSASAAAIKLLSDPSFDVFKAYRAFDDFEKQPLHATFLIDANGDIRWQDISYKPFMDIDFLLTESKRLLALPSTDNSPTPDHTTPSAPQNNSSDISR
jgi:peroxiredoxin